MRKASLPARVRKYLNTRNRAGRLFKEAAEMFSTDILPAMQKKRGKVKIGKAHVAILVDQFADRNTVFKPTAVDRFKVDIQDV